MKKLSYWRFLSINYLAFLLIMWASFLLYLYLPLAWGSPPTHLEIVITYSILSGITLITLIGAWIAWRKI